MGNGTSASIYTPAEALDRLRGLLGRVHLLTLCTSGRDGPWATTLGFTFDEDLDLFFHSRRASRHVSHILDDGKVAAALYDAPSRAWWSGRSEGIQLSGTAEVLGGREGLRALAMLARRFAGALHSSPDAIARRGGAVCRILPDRIAYLERARDVTRFAVVREGKNWRLGADRPSRR